MVYKPKDVPSDRINNSEPDSGKTLIRGGCVLLAILICFYFISFFVPALLTNITPLSFDRAVGNSMHKKMSLLENPNERLQKIFKLIDGKLEDEVKDTKFFVVKEKTENAYAVPGGRVYFTQAFIEAAESDNEILFVLGHELGHQKYRHSIKSLYTNFLSSVLLSLIGGVDQLSEMAVEATRTSFSRDQEREADLYGLELVQKIYGHTEGAYNFFERMNKKYGFLEKITGSVFSTHPLSKSRIEQLNKACLQKFPESSCVRIQSGSKKG